MKIISRLLLPALGLLVAAATARAQIAKNADHRTIDGIEVVALKTGVQDVVTLTGSLPAGDSRNPDGNPAIAKLTAGMLDKGTTQHDKFALSQLLGEVGANISFGANANALTVSARCLRKDLPLVLSLLAEELRSPAFAPEEFAKLKKQLAGGTQRALDDTDFRSSDAFSRAVYPLGHPNRAATPEEILAGADRATLDDVKAFYAKYYGPAAMKLVIVGDVDDAVARADIGKDFAGWTGGSPAPRPAKAGFVDASRDQNVFMPDKTNVSVMFGQATQLRYGDPDALALRLGTDALGGGLSSRLMATVRNQEGLTYGIYSYLSSDTYVDGDWRIWANFAPELLEKGLSSTRRELVQWQQNGITDAELAKVKGDFIGSYLVNLATTSGMATTILNTLNRDLPLSFIDNFNSTVNAISRDQVNAAIKRHIDPEKIVVIKAGTIPGALPTGK